MASTATEVRLEALKLAVRPGLDKESILHTAQEYFRFVMQGSEDEMAIPAGDRAMIEKPRSKARL